MSTAGAGFLIREMANRGLRIVAKPPDWKYQIMSAESETAPWEDVAGSLATVIDSTGWLFEWGVAGKLSGHDWLQCNSCDELQMLIKAKGAPSQKPKCHMTVACNGTYRRLPEIFEVEKPKRPRKRKPKLDSAPLMPMLEKETTMEDL